MSPFVAGRFLRGDCLILFVSLMAPFTMTYRRDTFYSMLDFTLPILNRTLTVKYIILRNKHIIKPDFYALSGKIMGMYADFHGIVQLYQPETVFGGTRFYPYCTFAPVHRVHSINLSGFL